MISLIFLNLAAFLQLEPTPADASILAPKSATIAPAKTPVGHPKSADPKQYKPEPPAPTVQRSISARMYAYTSTVGQTDASPFTTASGQRVADGIVANNCLPFGTKIRIPALFGEKVFVVQDRMNARYGCNAFDIWFANYGSAIQFGTRSATVEVLQ